MKRDAQTISLRDGRKLGFAEWGDMNGTGESALLSRWREIMQQILAHWRT